MRSLQSSWAVFALAVAGWIGTAGAQPTVTMVQSNSASGQSWSTTTNSISPFWSDGLAAHAGAFYEVDAGFTVRAPNSGSPTFPGDRLTMDGGQFNLSSSSGTTTTVGDLVLQAGGVVVNGSGSSTQTLAGALSIAAGQTGFIRTAGISDTRNITVSAAFSGAGTLHVYNRGTVSLTNAANTFSGTFRIGGLNIQPGTGVAQSNSSTVTTTLRGTVAGSLGNNASVEVNDYGFFNPDYSWSTTGSLKLNTNGVLVLDNADQMLSVHQLVINGSELAAGTYTYSQLSASYGSFIASGGQESASVTVVPEPAAAATLAAAAGCLLSRRRRRGIQ